MPNILTKVPEDKDTTMSAKLYVKPAKTIFVAQMVIVPLFMVFGFLFLFVADREVMVFLALFVLIWEAGCMAILINAVKAVKRMRDGKIEVAEIRGPAEADNDFSKKLRDLKALKTDGLLTDDEYQKKREEILDAKW
jgi:hypothetical protein